eukprot:1824147-Heterocapsa_arctica.AAC.1
MNERLMVFHPQRRHIQCPGTKDPSSRTVRIAVFPVQRRCERAGRPASLFRTKAACRARRKTRCRARFRRGTAGAGTDPGPVP